MQPEQNTFVFIDEDQRNKYSKSTLSAINAQVAKHAHKQRNKNAVKPKLPKSKSAPSSPPSVESTSKDNQSRRTGTQDDQLNRTRRKSAPDSVGVIARRGSSQRSSGSRLESNTSPKQRNESLKSKSNHTNFDDTNNYISNDKDEGPPPEALADLFQNLCRITKYPTYQAFPFFLDLEERRLAHYCELN